MGNLVVLLSLSAAGFFFYPQLNEEVKAPCHALERRVLSALPMSQAGLGRSDQAAARAFLGAIAGNFSDGSVASALIKQRYPNVPPAIGCALTYWRVVFDPDTVPRLAREAGLSR
jgi:hypothetical protein